MQSLPISRIVFNKYDKDNSGTITIDEFKLMAYDLGYYLSDNELNMAIKKLDKNGGDSVTYNDFCVWWKDSDRWKNIKSSEENENILSRISEQFQNFDTDKSGTIDRNEFRDFWKAVNNKKWVSKYQERTMFEKLDSNNDGEISFNE
eukprot:jgi/Orpsp1_1/1176841/evm.model.c7180000059218.2